MGKELYVISTPYHALNAINIIYHRASKKDIDLIILNVSKSTDHIMKICQRSKLFNSIDVYDIGTNWDRNKFTYIINRVARILLTRFLLPNRNESYDDIWIAGTEGYSKGIYYAIYKKNKNVRLHFFDDGIGSYNYVLSQDPNISRIKFFTKIYGFDLIDKVKDYWVYEPHLVMSEKKNINILPISKIRRRDHFVEYLLTIYDSSQVYDFSNKIVFLDTYFDGDDIDKQQIKLVEKLYKEYGNRIIVKLHPASKKNKYPNRIETIDRNVGMEELLITSKTNNMILVSVISTACLLPCFLFENGFNAIFIYKLIETEEGRFNRFDQLIQRVNLLWENSTQTPRDYSELIKTIGGINRKLQTENNAFTPK